MRKMGKSITALLMAAALTGSMLPATALAADSDAETSSEYEEIEADAASVDEETDVADVDEETEVDDADVEAASVEEDADVDDSDAESEDLAVEEETEDVDSTVVTAYESDSEETVDIASATIADIADQTYTGSAIKPTVTVTYGGATLVLDTDYSVSYSNNTNAGKATVTITGKGSYSGTKSAKFTINKASQVVTAEAESSSVVVGKKITITGSTTGDGALTYSLVSSSTGDAVVNKTTGKVKGVSPGKVKVKVTAAATDNYKKASKTITIKVIPAATSISSLKADRNGFKVTWKKVTTKTTGYQIQYSTTSDFSSKTTKTITSNSTTSKSYPSLKTNTKYYVRVRTYKTVDGTKYYSAWSSKKSIKTGKIVTKSGKKYYKYSDGTYVKSKFVTIGSKTYYFDKTGVMKTGWAKIGDYYYYFDRSTGVEQKSTTVDGVKLKSNGKASANSTQKTMIKTMITAREIMLENTSASDSKSAKLKKCFNWVLKHPYYRYRRLPEARTSATWLSTYANDEFKKGKGCCVSEACAFAYLAYEIGYEPYVCDDTGHAWVEINGKVYDTLFAEAKSYSKYYGSSYKTAGLYCVNKTELCDYD